MNDSADSSDGLIENVLAEFLTLASPNDDALHVAMVDLLRGQPIGLWAGEHPREYSVLTELLAFHHPLVPAENLPRSVRRFLLVWSYARRTLAAED
jgi:hypothetical protein